MAGTGILAYVITEMLKKLSTFAVEEISLSLGFKDELQNLKKTLDMILVVMVDAEKKQANEAVRLWLKELKDIAYEADDILDEYSYEVMHQHQMDRKRDRVRNFFSRSNQIAFRLKITNEIKDINQKFTKIAARKENLSLQMIEVGTSQTMNLDESRKVGETDPNVDLSSKIVGRDKDKSNIINKLLANNPRIKGEKIQVIPIVGMGGLGKTTLAQLIYNDDAIKDHFELKMWVYVSDDFDVNKLFIKIIESITNSKCEDVSNTNVIAHQVQQHLTGKKYLLILDDVRNKKPEEWVRFQKPLVVGRKGSKILVTTRSDKVASTMGGELQSYKLKILKMNESWSLFKKITFGFAGGVVKTPNLVVVGKKLVKKCLGLPRAVVFLSGLLQNNNDENEWRIINDNKLWNQSCDEDKSRILLILKLSYYHLSSHMKQCFSFFSIFSKDSTISRTILIQGWMAEGFLLQSDGGNNISMEELGNEYFNILLCNFFFKDVVKNIFGEVISFQLYDLVCDLAEDVAGDFEHLVLAADKNMESIPNVHRLSLSNFNEGMLTTVSKAFDHKTNLRTLFVSGTSKKIKNAFNNMKRLRVLDFLEVPNLEEIPSPLMGKLKHLRYLSLAFTQIRVLPESITRLYHLQTLRLVGCRNLKKLPKGIKKLINLRHLLLPCDINLPMEIGRLSSLQTLRPFPVGDNNNGCGVEVLEGLNLLKGSIKINHLRNVKRGIDAQLANLKGKKDLTAIYLSWHTLFSEARKKDSSNYDNNDEVVLEALQPHPNLKFLVIDQFFGAKFPLWMGGSSTSSSCLPNLVRLELYHCTKSKQLVGFGKLPSLKVLELWHMDEIKCLGNEFYDNSGAGGAGRGEGSDSSSSTGEADATTISVLFPSLEELLLLDMGSLEEWIDIPPPTPGVTYSCFPCLEKIDINCCPNLRITPTRFPSLKKLHLLEISGRVAVPLIIRNLNSLNSVELYAIKKLRFLPHCLLQGSNVSLLTVFGCLDFQGFLPNEGVQQQLQSSSTRLLFLVYLPVLKFLPDIRSFTSLECLGIVNCESFKPLPEDLTCLSSSLEHLKWVHIQNVKEVEAFQMGSYSEYERSRTFYIPASPSRRCCALAEIQY